MLHVFGRSDSVNECDEADGGGLGRVDQPTAGGRDRLPAGRGQDLEGAEWKETPAIHRRAEKTLGAQGEADWLQPIEGDRGPRDSADPAGVASEVDREEI